MKLFLLLFDFHYSFTQIRLSTVVFMSFFPKPGEEFEDDEPYELSGDEDDRLREEYNLV